MNAIKSMYNEIKVTNHTTRRNDLYLVNEENRVIVNGKTMTKDELNEKMAYFYEHGGPVMEL